MSKKNNTYSNELKVEIVQAYLTGNERMQKMADRYEICTVAQVTAWVKKYKEVGSKEAFERLSSVGSGEKGVKNPLNGKRILFKNVEERDFYKAQVVHLKKQYPNR